VDYLRYRSAAGRWVLFATVLGSSLASIDMTVVNIALPRIGRDFRAEFSGLQWTVNAYTLTLAAFLLLGGSLGDRHGRRRIFIVGVVWFTVASLACALAQSIGVLIAARALQGCGAALLLPESLAILESTFVPDDRAAAIGAWSGLGGVAIAIGPFVGGWLVEAVSWRLIFLLNVPLAFAVVWVARRHVPETRDPHAATLLDLPGVATAALGLAGIAYALTEAGAHGWGARPVLVTGIGGIVALVAMVVQERRSRQPMLPSELFRSRQFVAANLVTLLVYAALGGSVFLLPIVLQGVMKLSPLRSGAALAPVTAIMLGLSARAGGLAQRVGPRIPMSVGPIVAGVGLMLLARIGPGAAYLPDVLPALVVFGLGLALTVAPLTSTVLAAIGEERSGIASAVNNTVSRVAGLIAVAALPGIVGLTADAMNDPARLTTGFRAAMIVTGALCMAGGALAAFTIRDPAAVRE
jgi:EmrB/QacA subfamily drug resistance transporter